MNHMGIRKGMIINKRMVSVFDFRYVVVDYDWNNIYCVNLNGTGKIIRKVTKFTYTDFDNGLYIE